MLYTKHFIGARLNACPITSNSPCSAIASAIGAGASLIGGMISSGASAAMNRRAERIAREQMQFNADQASIARQWQEDYYNKYASPTAQAAQYRAGGLNPYLANVSPGSVPSGSAASYNNIPSYTNPGESLMSGINSAAQNVIAGYQAETQRKAQQSQEQLNSTLGNLNQAQEQLTNAQEQLTKQSTEAEKQRVERMKLDVNMLVKTFDAQVGNIYNQKIISDWMTKDVQFSAQQKMWDYYNISPVQRENMIAQTMSFYANAVKSFYDGEITRKDLQYYDKRFSLLQFAAATDRISANAAATDVANRGQLYQHQSALMDTQRYGYSLDNQRKKWYNDIQGDKVVSFRYNPKTKNYDIPYTDTRFRIGYNLTLQQNHMVLQNMLNQRDLWKNQQWNNNLNTINNFGNTIVNAVDKYRPVKPTTKTTEHFDGDGNFTGMSRSMQIH